MSLSKERIGEIALLMLQDKLEQDGIRLNPKEVGREIVGTSKRFGITKREGAEFVRNILKTAYDKTMAEVEAIMRTGKVEE